MNRECSVTFAPWDDGKEYKFRLTIGACRNIEEKCDAGPAWIYRRLCNGDWKTDDIRETLLQGLLSGGAEPKVANRLITRYVDNRPLWDNIENAKIALFARLGGVPDDPPKKASGATDETVPKPPSQTDGHDIPMSTSGAAFSASVPEASTDSPNGNSRT